MNFFIVASLIERTISSLSFAKQATKWRKNVSNLRAGSQDFVATAFLVNILHSSIAFSIVKASVLWFPPDIIVVLLRTLWR